MDIGQLIQSILNPQTKPLYRSPVPETAVGERLGPSDYQVQRNQALEQQATDPMPVKFNLPPVGSGPDIAPVQVQRPQSKPVQQVQAAETVQQPIQKTVQTGDKFTDFTTAKVPPQLHDIIYNSATKARIDPNVFASILFSEHGFQADRNKTPSYDVNGNFSGYDRGIAQINSMWHPEVTDEQAFDPNFAIPWAANLLSRYIQEVKSKGGNLAQGIAAYNVGVGGAMANGPGKLGQAGQYYLSKIVAGLTPQLRQRLGLI